MKYKVMNVTKGVKIRMGRGRPVAWMTSWKDGIVSDGFNGKKNHDRGIHDKYVYLDLRLTIFFLLLTLHTVLNFIAPVASR